MEPTTGYALLDGQRIAYQVIGEGPPDLVVVPSWFSAFDIEWEEPFIRSFFRRLASFVRVIRFDRRGSGASDPLRDDVLPPWEAFSEDIECVMDAVGSDSAVVWADGDAGPLGLLFAATHAERVQALILYNTSARFLADEDYPIGAPVESIEAVSNEITKDWGTGEQTALMVPSRAGDQDFQRWMGRLMRATTTPSSVQRYFEGVVTADAREALSAIEVPALVLHPVESLILGVDHGQYLADHLPNGSLVELHGPPDVYPTFALADQVLEAVEEFVTGARAPTHTERTLATVLFTDIVGSTTRAAEVGDQKWRRLLDLHDEAVDRDIAAHSGHLVKNTGDGILATFDGPGRAVHFASALQSDLARLGLHIRTGIHTGEVEHRDSDIGGLAVHIGARIMAAAGPDEILVSRTVKDLVIGSPITFEPRGTHTLKGIEGEWQLFSVGDA